MPEYLFQLNGITTKKNRPYQAMMNHNGPGGNGKSLAPHDRVSRFQKASKMIQISIQRNAPIEMDGCNCPVIVEGINDVRTLRELGFVGIVEKVNRGWPISKLVAYLHSTYGVRNLEDGGGAVILLMDWDRTGGRLQKSIRERMESLDVKVDEELRIELMKTMKPEGRTVESLRPHVASILSQMSGF
jgi:5S rRNA maturation endonuclease (ribonuclease M5)